MTISELFKSIGNAIRKMTGTTAKIKVSNIPNVLNNIVNRGAISTTIAPGGSYTIPQGYHNGSGVVKASDRSLAYYFNASSDHEKVYDLGFVPTSCNISSAIRWHSTNSAGWCRFYIYGSNDNSNWTTLLDSGAVSPGANKVGSYTYTKNTSGYRYIKVKFDGANGDWYLTLASVSGARLN